MDGPSRQRLYQEMAASLAVMAVSSLAAVQEVFRRLQVTLICIEGDVHFEFSDVTTQENLPLLDEPAIANDQHEHQLRRDRRNNAIRTMQREAADLLRDVFGNPFRPVAIPPAWLHWNNGTVPRLAQAIYDERRYQNLPILADALQDAGCTDETILAHCHSPTSHVRGCWVIDALLGKP